MTYLLDKEELKPGLIIFRRSDVRHRNYYCRVAVPKSKDGPSRGQRYKTISLNTASRWYRTMAYNFMLILCNTGMRTMEASNLRWRDLDTRTDALGRKFVVLNVRGKKKYRELVAQGSVAAYFERIRAISKATGSNDCIFTTHKGEPAITLYESVISDLLKETGLLLSSSGSIRRTYSSEYNNQFI